MTQLDQVKALMRFNQETLIEKVVESSGTKFGKRDRNRLERKTKRQLSIQYLENIELRATQTQDKVGKRPNPRIITPNTTNTKRIVRPVVPNNSKKTMVVVEESQEEEEVMNTVVTTRKIKSEFWFTC